MSSMLPRLGLRWKFHQTCENIDPEFKRDARTGGIKMSSEAIKTGTFKLDYVLERGAHESKR